MFLEIENLYKSFHSGLVKREKFIVYDNLNLKLRGDRIYGLIGKNGSGKTTLLKLCAGVLLPEKGSVVIYPEKINSTVDLFRKKTLYLSFQEKMMFEELTFEENLFLLNILLYQKHLLSENRIDNRETFRKEFYSLSSGEKNRIFIKVIENFNRDILLIDEPTSHLDDEGKEYLKEIIKKKKSENKIIIIASHIKSFLEKVCDEIIEIEKIK